MHAPLHLTALFGLMASAHSVNNPLRGLLRHNTAAGTVTADETNMNESTTTAPPASPSEVEAEETTGQEPPPPESLIAMQFSPDPHLTRNHMEMIMNGELQLASIRYSPTSFANDDYYSNVKAEFCDYDPTLNKQSQASDYPTVHTILSKSDHCGEHRYRMSLSEVMDAVRFNDYVVDNAPSSVRDRKSVV